MGGRLSYCDGAANYRVPATGEASPIYATGLWIAGKDSEDSTVGATARFSTGDYLPGPISLGTSNWATVQRYNRVWVISRSDIDNHIAQIDNPDYEIPEAILSWPAVGNIEESVDHDMAPFYDADSNGLYNPHCGDYPLIRGDKMAFTIFSDIGSHAETNCKAMGIEVHCSIYGFDEPADTALNNTLFASYRIFNHSGHTYGDTYLGAWTDFDIGYATDDYIGCDVTHGMAYGYNGNATDGMSNSSYGDNPPAQSCQILGGAMLEPDGRDNPKVDIDKMRLHFASQLESYALPDGSYDTVRLTADADLYYPSAWYFSPEDTLGNNAINGLGFGDGVADNERLGLTGFTYYQNSSTSIFGEPTGISDYYNYLRGRWRNGQPMKFGGNGANSYNTSDIPCRYIFPGNSDPWHWGTYGMVPEVDAGNWTEPALGNQPGDRRGLACSGPFRFADGMEQTLDVAYTTAFGPGDSENNAWASVEALQQRASEVRSRFVHDSTLSGRPFTYRPYSAPRTVGIAPTQYSQAQCKLYPNPTTGVLHMEITADSPQQARLYDMQGRCLRTLTVQPGSSHIDISALPHSIYMLRLQGQTFKVIKM